MIIFVRYKYRKMKKTLRTVTLFAFALLLTAACSLTSKLEEGEYMLRKNDVRVHDCAELHPANISAYIKQQPSSSFLSNAEPVVFNENLVKMSEDNIKSHLDYLGYYNAEVGSSVVVKDRKVNVTYDVFPGSRIIIDSLKLNISGSEGFISDFESVCGDLDGLVGSYLSESDLDAEAEKLSSSLRDLGYYGFSKSSFLFEADTVVHPGSAVLNLFVNGIPRSHIRNVNISVPAKLDFKEDVIKDLNTVFPGSLYRESDVNVTYNRLSALKVFNGVGISMNQVDSSSVDCDIKLSPSKTQGYKVDFEASSNSSGLIGLSPQISYYHKNIFHGGEWLNLSFLGNFQFKYGDDVRSNEFGLSAGLSFPKFLGINNRRFKGASIPRTEINASYNFQDRPEYTRHIFATSLGYSGTSRKVFSYQIYPVQVNYVRLNGMDPDFYEALSRNPFMRYSYQNHIDLGLGSVFLYSLEDRYIRLALDGSGNLLSLFNGALNSNSDGAKILLNVPYTQYVKTELTLGKSWFLGRSRKNSIAARVLAGVGFAYGNSTALPFEKQFYVGGANSLRGWQARSVGPGSSEMDKTFSIPSQTGDTKFEANLEYRFGLFWKLEGALFVDAGNVWTLSGDKESAGHFDLNRFRKTIAADWGVGVRVNLNFLVLRVDMGMKVHDPSLESRWISPSSWLKKNGYAVHFGVGYPF